MAWLWKLMKLVSRALLILGGIWWSGSLVSALYFHVASPRTSAASASSSSADSGLGGLRAAWEEGKLALRNGQLGQAVDVPRLEMFALDMTQGTYAVGTLVHLSDLYLTEYPRRSDEVWHIGSALLGSGKKYVNLDKTPIILTQHLARRLMEAMPEMGENLSPGFQRIYEISEMVGVVQPNPCADCLGVLWSGVRRVLLVKEITIETNKIVDAGWEKWRRS